LNKRADFWHPTKWSRLNWPNKINHIDDLIGWIKLMTFSSNLLLFVYIRWSLFLSSYWQLHLQSHDRIMSYLYNMVCFNHSKLLEILRNSKTRYLRKTCDLLILNNSLILNWNCRIILSNDPNYFACLFVSIVSICVVLCFRTVLCSIILCCVYIL
jgi:hypothetical protein